MLATPVKQRVDGTDERLDSKSALNAYHLVATDADGDAVLATSDDVSVVNRVLGVTLNSGTSVRVRTAGVVENPSWEFPAQAVLYVGPGGTLTPNPNTGLFTMPVGFAETPTRVHVRVGRAILRN